MNLDAMSFMKRKFKLQTIKRGLFIFSFLVVQIVSFFVFYIYVNFDSIMLAFQVPEGENLFYNFNYYFRHFNDTGSVFLESIVNTLIFFGTQYVLLLIGFIFSYFFYKKIRGYKFFRIVFYLPNIVSATALTMLFRKMININGPLLTLIDLIFDIGERPEFLANSSYAIWTLVVYMIWTGFGANILLLGGAMSRLPEDVMEYGRLDGIKPLREMFSVIVPMIWPTISTLMLLLVAAIFTSSGPILLFTKGQYGTYTISYYIWEQVYEKGPGLYPIASAIGLIFTVAGLPFVIGSRWLLNKLDKEVSY